MGHNIKRITLTFAPLLLGMTLGAPIAFAEDWDQARDRLRRAEEELGKDTRQYNEARANRDRKGMENEAREIQKDRADIARQRGDLNAMRGTYDVDRGWGRYDNRGSGRYDDRDYDRGRGRGWAWGHRKHDRDASATRRRHDRGRDDDGWRSQR